MPDSSMPQPATQLAMYGSELFESSPDCVKLLDAQGRILAMNLNGLCAMQIDDFSLVQDRQWATLWPADSQDLVRRALDQASAGAVGYFRAFCPTAKGAPRWWDVTVTTLLARSDMPRQILAVSRDVTEAHHAETVLRTSEARFRSLVTATSAIVWSVPPSGGFETEQPGWADFTGQTFEQYAGAGWLAAVHPDDHAPTLSAWQAALATGRPYLVEHRLRGADGQYRHMSVKGVPVHGADGTLREWVGVHTDITDSVLAAAERERLLGEVQAASRRMADAFREAPAFMCIQRGPELIYEMFNERYSAIVGGRARVGQSMREALPEISGQGYFEKHDRVYATGETFVGTNLPVFITDHNGIAAKHYVDVRYSALRDGAGNINGILTHGVDQTERHLAELARQAGQARLLLATEAAELGLWSWEPGTDTVVWENPRPCEILGIPAEQNSITARDFIDRFVHPDDADAFRAAIRATVEHGTRLMYQGRVRHHGQDPRWVECVGRARPASDGVPLQLIGTISDITERKLAEIALFESRERFQKIVNQAATGVIQSDAAGCISFVNQKYCDMLGYSEQELVGRKLLDFTAPAFVADTAAALARLRKSGKGVIIDKQYLRKDGAPVWATSSVNVLAGPDGQFQGLVAIVLDVTDRQLAAEELVATEQRYRTLFNSTDQGVCIMDVIFDADERAVDCRLVEFNTRYQQLSGLGSEAAGRSAQQAIPGLEQRWFDVFGAVARSGLPVHFESDSTALNGRWFDTFTTPIGGAEHRVAVLLRDVTERRQAEENLRILAADLSEADRRKTEFLATLAHELRNPLAPIRNGLHVMRLGGDSPATVARVREMLERQVQHMVHLIDDLLDIARISSGKLDLRRVRADVTAILGNAVETSMPLIESRQHRLAIDIPAQPLPAEVDVTRIAQVVSNLLNNAAKYTPPGGDIRLAARAERGEIVVTVTDSGVGIATESLGSVFDMFAQIDRDVDRAQGGLGIGLSLVSRLVRMHGGSVSAASGGAGQGSTFEIRLPLAEHALPPAAVPAAPDLAVASAGRRVLVVDDNHDAASTLAMILDAIGHHASVADGGAEALALVAQQRPDAIFLDIGMPGMDGYDTARALRARPGMQDVVLIALTGWGAADDRIRSREAGFNHHLTKPVELSAVQAILDSLELPAL